ncbi:MAG TPA: TolC family protein [Spirochaetota bacterium]|nr:TolC family protein [Spirochaetota bacterium]HPJ33899.1 TolC family protein [Spirochaetota bacterium]
MNSSLRNFIFRIALIYTAVMVLVSHLGAEPLPLSIDDAVKIALAGNHDYRIAELQAREAEERVNGVWGQLMPVLESEASLLRQYAENGTMSLSDGQADIKFIQMKFGINPGVFYNSLQASKKSWSLSKEELRRIKSDVEYNVIKSYFDLLLAGEIIGLREDSMQVLRANLKDVKNMYNTGTVPKFEMLQAQVQLMNQEPELFSAESGSRVALEMFNHNLGSARNSYTVKKEVLKGEVKPVICSDTDRKIEMLVSVALKNRPEVIQIKKKIEIAEHSEEVYSSYYLWPSFSVGGYYGMTKLAPNEIDATISTPLGPATPDFSGISGDDAWQNTWQVRVAATYRWGALFPAESVRAREREERLKAKEGEEEFRRLKSAISVSINSSYSKLLTACMTIKSQKENVKTAEEGLRIARESYRAGVIKNSELLASELALTSAKTSYINALYSYYVAMAELKKETGIEDENIILEDCR